MMRVLFGNLWWISVSGSLLYLLVMLISPLTKRFFSAVWHRRLLIAVLCFFAVPIGAAAASLLPLLRGIPGGPPDTFVAELPPPLTDYVTIKQAAGTAWTWLRDILPFIPAIWLGCAILVLGWKVWLLLRFRKMVFQSNLPVQDGWMKEALQVMREDMGIAAEITLAHNPCIQTPMLTGLRRPTLILPDMEWKKQELELILRHELTHYRHRDLWIKWAGMVVSALHWFNPIIWLLLGKLNYWMELACDEAIASGMDDANRRLYGAAILEVLERSRNRQSGMFAALCENRQNIKERLRTLLIMKNISKKTRNISMLVLALICIAGMMVGAAAYRPVSASSGETSANASPSAADKDVPLPDAEKSDAAPDESGEDQAPQFIRPTDDGYISCGFQQYEGHVGMDIANKIGTDIFASAPGIVTLVKREYYGYGQHVVIDHGDGYQTLYAQCDSILVEVGDTVEEGQVIAKMGRSGSATGPHLHFEIRKNGDYLDPEDFILFD